MAFDAAGARGVVVAAERGTGAVPKAVQGGHASNVEMVAERGTGAGPKAALGGHASNVEMAAEHGTGAGPKAVQGGAKGQAGLCAVPYPAVNRTGRLLPTGHHYGAPQWASLVRAQGHAASALHLLLSSSTSLGPCIPLSRP